jgi:hypothetical protein
MNAGLKLYDRGDGQIVSVECSSCHDPHNYGTVVNGDEPFLRMSNFNSQLCSTCHNK